MQDAIYLELGKLLGAVTRRHRGRIDAAVAQLGLNPSQAFMLLGMAQQDGRTHTEIAEHLQLSPPAATKIIKHMEQQGYVVRRPDPADERVSRVYLLDRGRALTALIFRAFLVLDEQMFTGLTEAELAQLREVLEKMLGNLQNAK